MAEGVAVAVAVGVRELGGITGGAQGWCRAEGARREVVDGGRCGTAAAVDGERPRVVAAGLPGCGSWSWAPSAAAPPP